MDDIQVRLTLPMPGPYYKALEGLAAAEYRTPRAQLLLLLREELSRRGLLPADEQKDAARGEGVNHASH